MADYVFPEPPYGFKAHMPFVAEGGLAFAGLCPRDGTRWRTHFHDGRMWRPFPAPRGPLTGRMRTAERTECNFAGWMHGGILLCSYMAACPFERHVLIAGTFTPETGFAPLHEQWCATGAVVEGRILDTEDGGAVVRDAGGAPGPLGDLLAESASPYDGLDTRELGYDFIYSLKSCREGLLVTCSRETDPAGPPGSSVEYGCYLARPDGSGAFLTCGHGPLYKPALAGDEWLTVVKRGRWPEDREIVLAGRVFYEERRWKG